MRSTTWMATSVLALAGVLGSCSSDSDQSTSGTVETGGSTTSATGGATTGGSPTTGNTGSASGGGTGGAVSTGTGGGSSFDGGAGTTSGGGSSMGGSGGAPACTATTEVSINDGTTGTGPDEFEFQGGWQTSAAAGKYQGDDHYSSTTGDTATVRFDGTAVSLHSATAPHHGIAEVSIDAGSPTDVDLYAATRADDVDVWQSGTLASGSHVLTIRVSGRQNAASTGTTVAVDRVVVERSACDGGAGGSSGSGGNAGAGGSTGGAPGTGGSGGGSVARPSYNTGTGFFVVGNKLYDPNGNEFRIRGVNKLHWDASSPGIPKTHANTERWVIDFTQPTTTNLGLMQQSVDNHIVPMPGSWQGTCDQAAATLTGIVDTWVAQASSWKTFDRTMILNIANEWGPSGTQWRDSYITAIGRLRTAGYLSTIAVDAGGCGQDNDDLVNYAKAVFDSDPQKNVIFDQHIYGNWANGNGQSWQIDLKTALDRLVATGLPVIVGEFGPGRGIGPSPTDITPHDIMQECEARSIGWMAWAWDDPASNADDTWFALSKNGNYDSSNDLTMFGRTVVEDPTYGLLVVAQPATIF